jgi:hypothetical protein
METMKKYVVFLTLLYSFSLKAQQPAAISDAEKKAVIDSIASNLQRYYVFPDKADAMAQYLKKQAHEKAYASISDYRTFIDALAKDLQQAHTDRHMNIAYSPEQVRQLKQWRSGPTPTAAMLEARDKQDSKANYGFVKVERLPGNIGYVDFRAFFAVNDASKNTVASAMGFIANTDAVIIDLRKNGGGDPEMVQLILSYFLDEKPVHYNSLYDRPANKTTPYYSLATVPGKKMPHTDLYVLTSSGTFSGAEEFAYNIKNLKRGILVGETTGGGAHPTRDYIINDKVVMGIPFARAINPFTKTNWEGTGVEPDIKIDAGKAVLKAQQLAFEKMISSTGNPEEKAQAAWSLAFINAQQQPVSISAAVKAAYAGTYGERTISLENGELFYQRGNGPKRKLMALAEDLFAVDGIDYFRLQFVRNKEGGTEKLIGVYDNGKRDESIRTATKSF